MGENTGIEIKQRLHDGIYKSSGGGETLTVQQYKIGPLNLLKAIREEAELAESNSRSYGSVGCGETWIEINGVDINEYYCGFDEWEMNMQGARELLAKLPDN